MSRGFTTSEKKELKERLIDVFIKKLNYQKISSINVEDLAKSVGIAKGSFYLFFKSKNELFAEVVNKIQDSIVHKAIAITKEKGLSDKDKLKQLILFLVDTIYRYPWIKQLSNIEYDKVIRKLPDETKEELRQKDITDITKILDLLDLKSNYSNETITIIVQIILSSALNKEDYGKKYDESVKVMINIIVENIFKGD